MTIALTRDDVASILQQWMEDRALNTDLVGNEGEWRLSTMSKTQVTMEFAMVAAPKKTRKRKKAAPVETKTTGGDLDLPIETETQYSTGTATFAFEPKDDIQIESAKPWDGKAVGASHI